MENSKPNAIVPYYDPTDEDQPSTEQLLDFGNEDAPTLGFDQNAQVPTPISSNHMANSDQVIVSSCTLVPISTPIFGRSGDSAPGPFHSFASSSRSGPPSSNFMPVPGNNLANWSNVGPSSSNVGAGLNSNVNFGDNVNGGNTFPHQVPNVNEGGVPFDQNEPIWDSNFWNFLDDPTVVHQGGQFPGGPSSVNPGGNYSDDIAQGGADFGNPISIPIWPILPSPYSCSGCHTLREITHTNGVTITNLEIHGRLGMNITHAILDTYDFSFSTENHTYQMFDFSNENINSIRSFLLQYCAYRRFEGYSLVEDPLADFYKALFVDMEDMENQNTFLQPTAMDTGNVSTQQQEITPSQPNPTSDQRENVSDNRQQNSISNVTGSTSDNRHQFPRQEGESSQETRGKTPLAIQRERTKKMKMKDFANCLHLKIEDAAKKMEVCPTVIKKKCRAAGLDRWPHRKIKSFKRLISIKKQQLANAKTDEERKSIKEEIQKYEDELTKLYELYAGEGKRE